jgi:hypothetical protein
MSIGKEQQGKAPDNAKLLKMNNTGKGTSPGRGELPSQVMQKCQKEITEGLMATPSQMLPQTISVRPSFHNSQSNQLMTNWTGTTATGNKSDSDQGEPIIKGSLPIQMGWKSGRFTMIH